MSTVRKIANTTELTGELQRLLAYASSHRPSRVRLASELRELSLRVAKAQKVKRFTAEQLDAMAPGKLEQELKRADDISSKLNDELIEAGRGNETASETHAKAKQQGDELAKRWAEAYDARSDLVAERKRRETYHGSTKRIVKKWSNVAASDADTVLDKVERQLKSKFPKLHFERFVEEEIGLGLSIEPKDRDPDSSVVNIHVSEDGDSSGVSAHHYGSGSSSSEGPDFDGADASKLTAAAIKLIEKHLTVKTAGFGKSKDEWITWLDKSVSQPSQTILEFTNHFARTMGDTFPPNVNRQAEKVYRAAQQLDREVGELFREMGQ